MSYQSSDDCEGSQECHRKNHICQIIVDRDLERINKLVKNGQYICNNCGRVAYSQENLCNPSKL